MASITRNPNMMGGRYCIDGVRMPVVQIKEMMRSAGAAWIFREFPWITQEQIDAAMAFRSKSRIDAAKNGA